VQSPPQPAQAASIALPITVLSTDPHVCGAIRMALSEQQIFVAGCIEEATQLASSQRCCILIVDEALTQQSSALCAYDAAMTTIVVGNRGQDDVVLQLLSAGVADRIMLKPITPALARIVIESAARKYQSRWAQLRSQISTADTLDIGPVPAEQLAATMPGRTEVAPLQRAPSSAIDAPGAGGAVVAHVAEHAYPSVSREYEVAAPVSARRPTGNKSTGLPRPSWGLVIAAVVVVAFAMWWLMSLRGPQIDAQAVITRNLAAAQAALTAQRYIEPAERSALHY
jgi:hypothetical protein